MLSLRSGGSAARVGDRYCYRCHADRCSLGWGSSVAERVLSPVIGQESPVVVFCRTGIRCCRTHSGFEPAVLTGIPGLVVLEPSLSADGAR
jgi:hypothetical protein